ncbi:MAG: ABC-type transport auxiliary lipoprotein family protein [Steroidobacteraceae bacterium]
MRLSGALLTACAALAVTGCTGLFHSTAPPEQTYLLRAPAPPAAAAPAVPPGAALASPAALPSIRVSQPGADPGLNSSRIILVQADHRLNFYSGSRWAGPVPDLVEALTVETLRASGGWQSVQDADSPFPSDYLLRIRVRRFEADYTGGGPAPEVHVVLDCVVGQREGREVLASFIAQGSATAAADRMSAVVAAFEQATDEALTSLAQQSHTAVAAAAATAGR